jgi:hypothetical protein
MELVHGILTDTLLKKNSHNGIPILICENLKAVGYLKEI